MLKVVMTLRKLAGFPVYTLLKTQTKLNHLMQ